VTPCARYASVLPCRASNSPRAWGSHRPIIHRTEGGHHLPTLDVAVRSAMLCGGSALDVGIAIDKAMADEARAAC